uniref:WD repeat domain, phosphoinositide interacting 1 n=1 Tax=Fundulus heteroclitus TaxID=8078 RepID=A0A3Q2P7M8_FUNHE
MEEADGAGEPGRQFGCASFNQDSTSLAMGTRSGYKLFSLTSVEKLDCIHESANTPDVYIVERLFSSSLVVVVSAAMPQRMNIYHFKKGTEICNYSYPNKILTIKLNRQRLVVFLEESIYVHNIKDMKLLKTLLNTPSNPSGLCALSTNHSSSYLAYPGSVTSGDIIIHDTNNLSTVAMIPAHDSPLAGLAFNASATKLASASERGTVIRVFSVPEGERLFEFRRGMKRYVNISSLSFSPDGQFLCSSSNTETVHIFKLEQPHILNQMLCHTIFVYLFKMTKMSSILGLLPFFLKNVVKLNSGHQLICGIQRLLRLMVATGDGQLFIYNVDPQDGGECQLAYQHSGGTNSEAGQLTQETHSSPSYAQTAALPASGCATTTLTGYSEDGGAKKGEVIPEHEFAAGPVCLDDENEFPPVKMLGSSRRTGLYCDLQL